jgi:hypothetical protein
MARLENTGVDAPAHMLHERAKEAPVDLGNAKICIDDYLGSIHKKLKINCGVATQSVLEFACRTASMLRHPNSIDRERVDFRGFMLLVHSRQLFRAYARNACSSRGMELVVHEG